jgi:tetrahydromethanopterin S-methyltransferase subunit G
MTARRDKGILIEEHSVKDLFERLDLIHAQVKKTNGRVTRLEGTSIGLWCTKNVVKAIAVCIILTIIVVSDFRQPLLQALLSIFI